MLFRSVDRGFQLCRPEGGFVGDARVLGGGGVELGFAHWLLLEWLVGWLLEWDLLLEAARSNLGSEELPF